MYKELGIFFLELGKGNRSLWKDGELWTAILAGIITTVWAYRDPSAMPHVRNHFGDILTVTSIVFGFVLTTLVFYVQAAGEWSSQPNVQTVARKIIDWHVLTILTLLAVLGYVLLLWAVGDRLNVGPLGPALELGLLGYLITYGGGQIVNHTLTVWWIFRQQSRLKPPEQSNIKPVSPRRAK